MKYRATLFAVLMVVTTFAVPTHLSALGSREGVVGDIETDEVRRLEIKAHGFDVVVRAVAGDKTRLKLSDASDEYELHHALRDGVLEVWTVGPSMSFELSPEGSVQVEVPTEISIAVRTAGGAVAVTGVAGSVAVHTGSGRVELTDLVTAIDIETTSGTIV